MIDYCSVVCVHGENDVSYLERTNESIHREREKLLEKSQRIQSRTHQWTLSSFSISTCVNLASCQRDTKTNNESANEREKGARRDEWNSSTRCVHIAHQTCISRDSSKSPWPDGNETKEAVELSEKNKYLPMAGRTITVPKCAPARSKTDSATDEVSRYRHQWIDANVRR